MNNLKRFSILFAAFFWSCNNSPQKIHLRLLASPSPASITITGLDPAIAGEIARDSSQQEWQALIPVYKMPNDTDMKDYQKPQPGTYGVNDAAIVFTPDTPFVHGQTYFLRCYDPGKRESTMDMIHGRRKLGSEAYTDLTFKK